jgi:hypothetical protein
MFISLLSICGLRILWTQTIFKLIPTPVCLFLSYPASWAMGTVVYLIVLSRILPRLIASQENEMSD